MRRSRVVLHHVAVAIEGGDRERQRLARHRGRRQIGERVRCSRSGAYMCDRARGESAARRICRDNRLFSGSCENDAYRRRALHRGRKRQVG